MKWSSLQKSMSKFRTKKFHEIENKYNNSSISDDEKSFITFKHFCLDLKMKERLTILTLKEFLEIEGKVILWTSHFISQAFHKAFRWM